MSSDPDFQRKLKALQIARLEADKALAHGATRDQATAVWQSSLAASGTGTTMDPIAGLLFVGLFGLFGLCIYVDSWWPMAVIPAYDLIPRLPKIWAVLRGLSYRVYVGAGLTSAVALVPYIYSWLPNVHSQPERPTTAAPGYGPQYASRAPVLAPAPAAAPAAPEAPVIPEAQAAPVEAPAASVAEASLQAAASTLSPQPPLFAVPPALEPVAPILRGAYLGDWGRVATAMQATWRVTAVPDNVAAELMVPYKAAMQARKNKDHVRARDGFRKVLDAAPDDPVTALNYSLSAMELGDGDSAAVELARVLKSRSDQYSLWFTLALTQGAAPEVMYSALLMGIHTQDHVSQSQELLDALLKDTTDPTRRAVLERAMAQIGKVPAAANMGKMPRGQS